MVAAFGGDWQASAGSTGSAAEVAQGRWSSTLVVFAFPAPVRRGYRPSLLRGVSQADSFVTKEVNDSFEFIMLNSHSLMHILKFRRDNQRLFNKADH